MTFFASISYIYYISQYRVDHAAGKILQKSQWFKSIKVYFCLYSDHASLVTIRGAVPHMVASSIFWAPNINHTPVAPEAGEEWAGQESTRNKHSHEKVTWLLPSHHISLAKASHRATLDLKG